MERLFEVHTLIEFYSILQEVDDVQILFHLQQLGVVKPFVNCQRSIGPNQKCGAPPELVTSENLALGEINGSTNS